MPVALCPGAVLRPEGWLQLIPGLPLEPRLFSHLIAKPIVWLTVVPASAGCTKSLGPAHTVGISDVHPAGHRATVHGRATGHRVALDVRLLPPHRPAHRLGILHLPLPNTDLLGDDLA